MKRIIFVSFLLILLLFVPAQYMVDAESNTINKQKEITLDLNNFDNVLPDEVIDELKHDLKNKNKFNNEYAIGHIRYEGTWGIGTIIPKDNNNETSIKEKHVSELQINNSQNFAFIYHNGHWLAGINSSRNINKILELIPASEISDNIKHDMFKNNNMSIAVDYDQEYEGYKFPFNKDTGFKLFRVSTGVWHSTDDKAIDFAPLADVNVMAIAPGYVSDVCKNSDGEQAWIKIKTEDPNNPGTYLSGEQPLYLHFDKDTIPSNITEGSTVERGQLLGKLVSGGDELKQTCPMYGDGRHVHILLPYKPFKIDGYSFESYDNGDLKIIDRLGDELEYTSSTTFYSTQGNEYESDLWIISSDYIVNEDIHAGGDIYVTNNSELRIKDNASLNIMFDTNKLVIESGARLIIENGSKIY